MVLSRTVNGGQEKGRLMETVRGHEMARGALKSAVWDIEAQCNGLPLGVQLGGTLEEIRCGVALGIQRNLDTLLCKVGDEVEAGYQQVKLKIKPGYDVEILEQVRRAFPDTNLMVDGNSSYRLTNAAVFQQPSQIICAPAQKAERDHGLSKLTKAA